MRRALVLCLLLAASCAAAPPKPALRGPVPVGDITIGGLGTLEVQPDVTALEATNLLHMLVIALANPGMTAIDYVAFVREHHLERHFKPGPAPAPKP